MGLPRMQVMQHSLLPGAAGRRPTRKRASWLRSGSRGSSGALLANFVVAESQVRELKGGGEPGVRSSWWIFPLYKLTHTVGRGTGTYTKSKEEMKTEQDLNLRMTTASI